MPSKQYVCAFLLKGKVQGVKLRRYVEAAGRHFGVGGYVINTEGGDVWGEAWRAENDPQIQGFETWIRGEHVPAVYTNIKPTPVGTAYPEKAQVQQLAVLNQEDDTMDETYAERFARFTMVRDDQEAAVLLQERLEKQTRLASTLAKQDCTENAGEIKTGAWLKR